MGTFSFTRMLRRGRKGEDVRQLQSLLNSLGFDAGTEDGVFGQKTLHALATFQKDAGLSADGVAGPNTFDALGTYATEAEEDYEEIDFTEDDDESNFEDDFEFEDDDFTADADEDEGYEEEEYDASDEEDDEYDEWALGDRELEEGDEGNDVLQLQEAFATLEYDITESDGVFGSETLEVLLSFQNDYDLEETGVLDEETLEALQKALEEVEEDEL